MAHHHDRPLAAPGLNSYRYRGNYGWIMIGARDDADALREAGRSVEGGVTMDRLQVWRGTKYVPVRAHAPNQANRGRSMRPNTMRSESRWQIGDTEAVYEFLVKLSTRVRGVNITDGQLEEETRFAVEVFADQLRSDYRWVGDVYLTGRSGGWLAIQDKLGQATEDELSDINDRVDQARKDFETAIVEGFGYTENPGRITPALRKAYDFFRAHAGGIVGESGKGALDLARAEKRADVLGWRVHWEEDPEEYQMGDAETERPHEVLIATLKDENGDVLGSLGSIGMTGKSRQDRDYGRVIEAELALEALAQKGLL